MNEDMREMLAEEQGLYPCPHSYESYATCNGDCKHCELSIEFEDEIKTLDEAHEI